MNFADGDTSRGLALALASASVAHAVASVSALAGSLATAARA